MSKISTFFITLAFFGLSAGVSNAQTWQIGSPNASDLTATFSGDSNNGYTLTISGRGAMQDFTEGTSPWYNYNINNIVIQPGVTYIGAYAFCDIWGYYSDLNIPNTVTSIGVSAFDNCGSSSSNYVTIPSSVVTIENNAFRNCYYSAFQVDDANPSYSSEDGVLFDKGKTTLISCPACKAESYTAPGSVTTIKDYAFYGCSYLTSVTVPNSVTSIGEHAFENAYKNSRGTPEITSISLSNRLTNIGNSAFYGCSFDYVKLPKSLTNLGANAFASCSNLKTVEVELDTPLSITSDVFAGLNLASCTLIVPIGKTAAYKAANVWKNFGTIKERVAVTGISLSQTSATIGTSSTLQLTATVAPANATYQTVVWTSSNTNVATVSATGLVTSYYNGTSVITVTTQDGGYSASCALTVQFGDGTFNGIDVSMSPYSNNYSYKTISGFDDPISCLDFSKNEPFNINVNLSSNSQTVPSIKVSLLVPKREYTESFMPISEFGYFDGNVNCYPTFNDLVKIKEFTINPSLVWDDYSQNYIGKEIIPWDGMTDPALTNGISYPVQDNVFFLVANAQTGEILKYPQYWYPQRVSHYSGQYAYSFTAKEHSVVCDIYFISQLPIKKAVTFIGDACGWGNADWSQSRKGGIEKVVLSLHTRGSGFSNLSAYQAFDNLSPDENGIYHISWEIKDLQGNFYDAYKLFSNPDNAGYELGLYFEGEGEETFNLGLPGYGGQYGDGFGDYQPIQSLMGYAKMTPPRPLNPDETVNYPEFEIENGVLLHYHGAGGNVVIPNTVNAINDMAFFMHTNIQTLTIPAAVTTIGDAFDGCSGLTSITVATNNQNYCSENGVLYNKDKTVLIEYPDGKNDYNFVIPNSVQTIADYAFDDAGFLSSITIPASVRTIGTAPFFSCTGINNVYVNWTTPLVLPMATNGIWSPTHIFFNTYCGSATLHVPAGTKTLYRAANQWKDFGTIKDDIVASTENISNTSFHACFINNMLRVESPQAETITIYSTIGVQLYSVKKDPGMIEIPFSSIQGSVYIIKGSVSGTIKVMK